MSVAGAEQHGHSSPSSTRMRDFQPQLHPRSQASSADGAGPPSSEGGSKPPVKALNELLSEEALYDRMIFKHNGVGPLSSDAGHSSGADMVL